MNTQDGNLHSIRPRPRGLPVRFEEVTPMRKPGKNATTEQKAAYRPGQEGA